ncbi:Panacea domain-containing protein [Leptospira levettii]|uniref:DUF4065 domain-containing protein n=1 Tax=Leptospira levettii TaxID=2023178 RepID=A0ABY2MTW0_9LEPT|nr:Panacea domain-containing protein [Leptospira levettii]TGL75415.1 DUF4065 domain-containing protein [Leptospira levettii]
MELNTQQSYFPYDKQKAIEAVSFFLDQVPEKKLAIITIVKLLYFSEREYLINNGEPLFGEELYSLPFGPVVSKTYDAIKSQEKLEKDVQLREHFARVDNFLILKKVFPIKRLSRNELRHLKSIFEKFGHYTVAQLMDYCHDKDLTPEWKDPGNSRIPIYHGDLLRVWKVANEDIKEIAALGDVYQEIEDFQNLSSVS